MGLRVFLVSLLTPNSHHRLSRKGKAISFFIGKKLGPWLVRVIETFKPQARKQAPIYPDSLHAPGLTIRFGTRVIHLSPDTLGSLVLLFTNHNWV